MSCSKFINVYTFIKIIVRTLKFLQMKPYTSALLNLSLGIAFMFLLTVKGFSQAKPWVAPSSALTKENPIKGNTQVLPDAKKLYQTNCSPCHGNGGKGDGPAASACNPKPADHTSAKIQSEPDGSLFWKISEGRNPMPAFKQAFSETQRWQLVNFIRSLAKKS